MDDLLEFVQADGRICPQPRRWDELWRLLPGRKRVGSGWDPPLPLILAAWWSTSPQQKRARLQEHIVYAADHDALEAVNQFLRALPHADWARDTRS